MDVEQKEAVVRTSADWERVLAAGLLRSVKPEEMFAACLALDRRAEGRLVGEMMAALAEISARFLLKRVSRSKPNGGADIVKATLEKLQDAMLEAGHPDAVGYSTKFFAKLELRLLDQIRRSANRSGRELPVGVDEEGQEMEFPDIALVTPEQALAIDELLHDVDPRMRRALALTMAGYPAYTDRPGGNSVASMLGVSRKTAETWVRETKSLVKERMES